MTAAPYLLGRRGPGAAIIVGGGGGSGDGGFVDEPVVTTTSSGDTTIKGKVKAGSFGKFVYPMATIMAGMRYTFRTTASFSQLAQQGRLAMVGFGLKSGNDFHMAGLRGDGSTGCAVYEVYGTPPNGWNAQTGHSVIDSGAPAHGTQYVAYHRLTISADGTTADYATSDDGATWVDELSAISLSPFSNVSSVTTFGIALWFNNADAGPFSIAIDQFASTIVLVPSYWNPGARGDRTSSITVTTTATLGAGTINNLVDGAFAANSTDGCWFTNGQSSREVKFDFGVGKIVDGFFWYQSANSSQGTWVLEGSNDDSSYAQIGSSFTLANSTRQLSPYKFTNATAYRYYKLRQTAGTTSSVPWLREIEFSIAEPGVDALRDILESGDRSSMIAVTTTATTALGSTINNLVDGDYSLGSTGSVAVTSGQTTREIKFDLGITKTVTDFLWLQNSDTSNGTWTFEASNDDSSYTALSTGISLGVSANQVVTFANSTAYRYYKLRQTAGTTSSIPFFVEMIFKIT